jgi:hypothetical protein
VLLLRFADNQKNGKRCGKQQYKGHACGRQFTGGKRLLTPELWQEHVRKKQTCKEIAERFSVSESTVKRRLQTVNADFDCKEFSPGGVILMDTAYSGKNWGVVFLQSSISGKKLWRKYVNNERLIDYQEGTDFIKPENYQIFGTVCDGFKGISKQFSMYPLQMCQKHQIDIIRRNLTENPKLQAGKELCVLIKNIIKL